MVSHFYSYLFFCQPIHGYFITQMCRKFHTQRPQLCTLVFFFFYCTNHGALRSLSTLSTYSQLIKKKKGIVKMLTSQWPVRFYILYLLTVVNRIIFSSILQIWYVEVRISRSMSDSPVEFEITRVDCTFSGTCLNGSLFRRYKNRSIVVWFMVFLCSGFRLPLITFLWSLF